jgi:hypothetical protein
MTDELLAAGLAETAGDRIRSFLHAADARLEELGRLAGKNEDLEEELATAYTLLLREGVAVVLDDREEPAEEISTARKIARDRAQQHISTLKDLNSAATGKAKAAVGQALEASLELARR